MNEVRRKKEICITHMRQVYDDIDLDNSGDISIDELYAFLQDDTYKLKSYLSVLDLNVTDVEVFFKL